MYIYDATVSFISSNIYSNVASLSVSVLALIVTFHRPLELMVCLLGGMCSAFGGVSWLPALGGQNVRASGPRTPINHVPLPRWTHIVSYCLQGGGVYIRGGTVNFNDVNIYGNQATYVSARIFSRNVPSPR